jgi:hypothetical protein
LLLDTQPPAFNTLRICTTAAQQNADHHDPTMIITMSGPTLPHLCVPPCDPSSAKSKHWSLRNHNLTKPFHIWQRHGSTKVMCCAVLCVHPPLPVPHAVC